MAMEQSVEHAIAAPKVPGTSLVYSLLFLKRHVPSYLLSPAVYYVREPILRLFGTQPKMWRYNSNASYTKCVSKHHNVSIGPIFFQKTANFLFKRLQKSKVWKKQSNPPMSRPPVYPNEAETRLGLVLASFTHCSYRCCDLRAFSSAILRSFSSLCFIYKNKFGRNYRQLTSSRLKAF